MQGRDCEGEYFGFVGDSTIQDQSVQLFGIRDYQTCRSIGEKCQECIFGPRIGEAGGMQCRRRRRMGGGECNGRHDLQMDPDGPPECEMVASGGLT